MRWLCLVASVLLIGESLGAADFEILESGPVHEAFVGQTQGGLVLQAVEKQPPAKLDEHVGSPCEEGTKWIPGYWEWSDDQNDFIWVSGVWRHPPTDHEWIAGFWKQMDEGWVRFHGFWSPSKLEDLQAISAMPPDPLQEDPKEAPGENHFWMPGHWAHAKGKSDFQWYKGQWEEVDEEWIFVPAQWVWRPNGYLFVDAYWDYPLEDRGCAYPPLKVGAGAKGSTHEVDRALEPSAVVERLLVNYPNYATFFQQHYLTHRTFWNRYPDTPPWWAWSPWWTQTWWDQWAMFWWWTHPGYPQPAWITITTSTRIWPPPAGLIRRMGKVMPPYVVTPEGVVSPSRVMKETARITEKRAEQMNPLLPAKASVRQTIEKAAEPKRHEGVRPLRPSGRPPGPGEKVEQPGPKLNIKGESAPDEQKVQPPKVPSKPDKGADHPLRKQDRLTPPPKGEQKTQDSMPKSSQQKSDSSQPPMRPRAAPASGNGSKQAQPLRSSPSGEPPPSQGGRSSSSPGAQKRSSGSFEGGGQQPPTQPSQPKEPRGQSVPSQSGTGKREAPPPKDMEQQSAAYVPARRGRAACYRDGSFRVARSSKRQPFLSDKQVCQNPADVRMEGGQGEEPQGRTPAPAPAPASDQPDRQEQGNRATPPPKNPTPVTSFRGRSGQIAQVRGVVGHRGGGRPVAQRVPQRRERPERRPDCPQPQRPRPERRGRGGRSIESKTRGAPAAKRPGRWAAVYAPSENESGARG